MITLFEFRLQVSKLKLQYLLEILENPQQIHSKRKTIPSSIKQQMWEKYISKELRIGKCFCCRNKDILETDCHAGHVISDKEGGKAELDNLRPLCSKCNQSMGSENMYSFIYNYRHWKE
jgi:5-methylcytosine-specific restriction endonuclease McrA